MDKGTFQTIPPPNLSGNATEIPQKKISVKWTSEINMGKNTTVKLYGLKNDAVEGDMDAYSWGESDADVQFRIIENTYGGNISEMIKAHLAFAGLGIGFQNLPYGYLMAGLNSKHLELGGNLFGGVAYNKAAYEGLYTYWDIPSFGLGPDCGSGDVNESRWILHTYYGASVFASIYFGGFAVVYGGSITWPWGLVDELSVTDHGFYDISFSFPYILSQNIGLAYTYKSYQGMVGVSQIVGEAFGGRTYSLNFKFSKYMNFL